MDGPRILPSAVDLFSQDTPTAIGGFRTPEGTAAIFRRHLNTTFLVHSGTGARMALRLASVVERPLAGQLEQFSLIFHAPEGTMDLHGTRAFEHRALGRFDVFIVPIGAAIGTPRVYEACFSRLVGGSGTSHG